MCTEMLHISAHVGLAFLQRKPWYAKRKVAVPKKLISATGNIAGTPNLILFYILVIFHQLPHPHGVFIYSYLTDKNWNITTALEDTETL